MSRRAAECAELALARARGLPCPSAEIAGLVRAIEAGLSREREAAAARLVLRAPGGLSAKRARLTRDMADQLCSPESRTEFAARERKLDLAFEAAPVDDAVFDAGIWNKDVARVVPREEQAMLATKAARARLDAGTDELQELRHMTKLFAREMKSGLEAVLRCVAHEQPRGMLEEVVRDELATADAFIKNEL